MRIALLTEGVSEYRNLGPLMSQVRERTGHTYLAPTRVVMCPGSNAAKIARACQAGLKIAKSKRADLVVVLLDRETDSRCPGIVAAEIEGAIAKTCSDMQVRVCLKDRMLENWLVADPDALAQHSARYEVTHALRRKVAPNRADRVDATGMIKKAVRAPSQYEKVADSELILKSLDVARAAQNSRSLRHFLHSLGDAAFSENCREPLDTMGRGQRQSK